MTKHQLPGAKITAKAADRLRRELLKHGFLEPKYYIRREKHEQEVVFPLQHKLSTKEIALIQAAIKSPFQIQMFSFIMRKQHPSTLQEALTDVIPKKLHPQIPSAIDFIGDLAIIDLPSSLDNYGEKIGQGIIGMNPRISGVFRKAGAVSGQFRLRKLRWLTGAHRTSTIHHENGCRYYVDVAQTYFSGRLSTERLRVADQIQKGARVLDMFAGVGPYSILIARRGAKVVAVDVNPHATELLKQNAVLNKVQSQVIVLTGDIREVNRQSWQGQCDYVIMNLPGHAIKYLDIAITALKSIGGIIYFYCFQKEPNLETGVTNSITPLIQQLGGKLESIQDIRKVRMAAPHEWQMCAELKIIPQ
jgi:tRNA (guanine37-N1)-methyltransferase